MNSLEKYFSNSKINFDSPIPYYIQIKEKIKEQIDSGLLKYGDPSSFACTGEVSDTLEPKTLNRYGFTEWSSTFSLSIMFSLTIL